MSENAYKKARVEAAKKNKMFKTVEKTHSEFFISREKLLKIEKGLSDPTPELVVQMAELYSAPELLDYYCTNQCPVGKGSKPLSYDNLGEISSGLMSALYFLNQANDKIHLILKDSIIQDDEREEFEKILQVLKDIAYSVDCLGLWAKKNSVDE